MERVCSLGRVTSDRLRDDRERLERVRPEMPDALDRPDEDPGEKPDAMRRDEREVEMSQNA